MGRNQLVIIRTDANSKIATGHLVRCLSIADACIRRGMKVWFLVSDEESENFVIKEVSVKVLANADYQDLEQEISTLPCVLKDIMEQEGCSYDNTVFLLDSYFVTLKYLNALKGQIKTAYLDDLQLFDYPVNLVINYDVIPPERMAAYEAVYGNVEKTLLGPAYTPLRQQFQNIDYSIRNEINDIIITTGGSDPCHLCLEITQHFATTSFHTSENHMNLHIVLGKYNEDRAALLELAEELPFLQLHENVTDMAALMKRCDLAISASGTTLYELCAVGVPTISYTMADNQITCARSFAEAGAIPCAGDVRTEKEQIIDRVLSFVTEMSENIDKRKSAHDAMSRLVDGKGALRIAEALQEL